MKFIHLMKKEKFTEGVVKFYDRYFDNGEHEILYINKKGSESLINPDIRIKQMELSLSDDIFEKNLTLYSFLKKQKFDYLVLHSLFLSSVEKAMFLVTPSLLDKIVWIEWGADLYSWKDGGKGAKRKIKNRINYVFRNRLKHIVCIFPPDIDYFKTEFPRSRARIYYAQYESYPPMSEYAEYSQCSCLRDCISKGETIYIQVGQNSLPTLNHIEVLNTLQKFKDENIKIFLPLSYGGTEEYAKKVAEYAEKLFPGKIIILKDFLPQEKYFELTKKISIAIFHTERQCALGNIHTFNFRNVKVYLSESGVMYHYFLNRGVPVKKYEDIEKMSYQEFIEPQVVTEKGEFQNYLDELSNIQYAVEQWKLIYTDLIKESY